MMDHLDTERVQIEKPSRPMEVKLNLLVDHLEELEKNRSAKNIKEILSVEQEYENILIQLKFIDRRPKELTGSELKELLSVMPLHEDFNVLKYRKKIHNTGTAVRAMCVRCMGGAVFEVRQCPSMHCPLWSFRMGSNSFYGKLSDEEAEAEATEEYEGEVDVLVIGEVITDGNET